MKKRIIYIFAIVLALILCTAIFVACDEATEENADGGSADAGGEGAASDSESVAPEETLDDSKFNLYFNDKYLCAFVQGDKATEDEKAVAKELRLALTKKTGKQITFITESKVTDEYKYLIVVGETNFEESKKAYKSLDERDAVAKVVGNKLIIAFGSKGSGLGMVKTLMDSVEANKNGAIRLSHTYKKEYRALPSIDALPTYNKSATQTIDLGQETVMTYVASATRASFNEYCQSVEAAEFKKIADRTEKSNVFMTFVGETEYIYAYFSNYNSSMRIITGPIDQLAMDDYSVKADSPEISPYIASIPQPGNGMGYIIRLADGSFMIFDGGYSGGDRVYSTLRQLEPKGELVIAAWFISHPHGDHYPAFIDFIKAHGNDSKVTIEKVIHNYVHPDMYNIVNGTAGTENCSTDVKKLYTEAEKYIPDVPIIKAHTGQVMTFGETQVEILYTVEDMVPTKMENSNASSMVVRVMMEGHSIMFLADTYVTSARILHNMWGNYLNSDIMQIAHHGQWPSISEIYDDIQGQLVLVPALKQNYKNDVVDSQWIGVTNTVMKYAKDLSISCDKVEKIDLPYKIKNNKDTVLNELKTLRG